jgi:predicted MFS family arabinose efflux permease
MMVFFDGSSGDKIERKSQILYTTFASVIALIIAATAQSYFVLEIASLLIGISIVPQLILPLAASLSAPEERKVVGTIMSGLLVGFCCPEP